MRIKREGTLMQRSLRGILRLSFGIGLLAVCASVAAPAQSARPSEAHAPQTARQARGSESTAAEDRQPEGLLQRGGRAGTQHVQTFGQPGAQPDGRASQGQAPGTSETAMVRLAPPNPASVGARLPSRLVPPLKMLGERFEKRGQERVTLTGTLNWSAGTSTVRLTWEYPGLLRVDLDTGRILTFDGMRFSTNGEPLESHESRLIEALLQDSPEHFLIGQATGFASRLLGLRFRLDNGRDRAYRGPYYDVFAVVNPSGGQASARARKFYYFNSDSQLLERVRYEAPGPGGPVQAETELADWRTEQGERVPYRITHSRAGETDFSCTFTAVTVGPRVNDGIFTRP